MAQSARTHLVVLALLCFTAAAFNLTKAVHIDDTAYLQSAEHITKYPLRPMSFLLNWGDGGRRAFDEMNQPVLFFYLLAGLMRLFGDSVLAFHSAMAVASSAAIVLGYRVAKRVAPDGALALAALCGLSPAFLPAQNVMTDVPLLALWLFAVDRLLQARESARSGRHYALAGVAVAVACLIKYSSLGLLVAMAAIVISRRRWLALFALAIPIGAVAGWSWWNYVSYGKVHLLARPRGAIELLTVSAQAVDWVVGVGLALPWASLLLFRRPFTWRTAAGAGLALGSAVAIFAGVRMNAPGSGQAAWLTAALVFNGVLAVLGAARAIISRWPASTALERDHSIVFVCTLCGAAGFILLFAPFMAMRHVLPAVPLLALMIWRGAGQWWARPAVAATAVAITAVIGGALAAADSAWAAVYPRQATIMAARYPDPNCVVSFGHWGWQWYTSRLGWQSYDRWRTRFEPCVIILKPTVVHQQNATPEHLQRLDLIETTPIPATPWTTIRTLGLYHYSWQEGVAPFVFSRQPIETFNVYRVRQEPTSEAIGIGSTR